MPVYDGFVTAFVSNNFQLLFEALESGTSVLIDDHFLGLVSRIYPCFMLHLLQNVDICSTRMNGYDSEEMR